MDPKPTNEVTITVDWNNPQSIGRAISRLNARRSKVLEEFGFRAVTFNGSKYNIDKMLPMLDSVYEADLSSIYANCDDSKIHYVYFHCDPRKRLVAQSNVKHFFLATKFNTLRHIPFYVGKGVGGRYLDLTRNDAHRKIRSQLISSGQEIVSVKVAERLSEAEALSLESKLIDILGLKALSEHGMLVNLDEGNKPHERRAIYGKDVEKAVIMRNGFRRAGG